MSQLTTNTTTIDELITMANNLPDAGSSSGGSAEMCTITFGDVVFGPITYSDGTQLITDDYILTEIGATVRVLKNSIIYINDTDMSTNSFTIDDDTKAEVLFSSGSRHHIIAIKGDCVLTPNYSLG